ncbi:hypothetical protein [Streptomyces sp. NPDC059564]|uniref:hypothetical protein n=1 Tax=Streptomyces sp. NPDC059564 TaxID=3346865 RepID=UPI00368909A5
MNTGAFEEITTEGELRELLGEPTPVALGKELRTLHDHHRQWVARSPLCLSADHGDPRGPGVRRPAGAGVFGLLHPDEVERQPGDS